MADILLLFFCLYSDGFTPLLYPSPYTLYLLFLHVSFTGEDMLMEVWSTEIHLITMLSSVITNYSTMFHETPNQMTKRSKYKYGRTLWKTGNPSPSCGQMSRTPWATIWLPIAVHTMIASTIIWITFGHVMEPDGNEATGILMSGYTAWGMRAFSGTSEKERALII